MDLNLTRVFVAVYEGGSLTAAANRLFVTQSAVSQSLKRLRDVLDDSLFERAGNGVRPTPLADAIYPSFRDAVGSVDRVLDAVRGFDAANAERTFRIALSELGEIGWLPSIASQFAEQAPFARLEVTPLLNDQVVEALARGSIDLAITSATLGHGFEHTLVKQERYRVILSSSHPLTSSTISVDEYRTARRVGVVGDSSSQLLESAHRGLGGVLPAAISVQNFATIPPLLTQASGFIAVVPETLAVGWSHAWPLTLAVLPFDLPVAELHLYRRSTTQHSGALEWFFALVQQAVTQTRGTFDSIQGVSAISSRG